ncbi:MAG: ABC transporter substrate-binding protein [Dehalococcoidales bacterium]|nr:ABC transporter substrate-binding protein [Dehalococcoidales bacterium]
MKIGLSLCYTGPAGEKGRVMSDGILDVWKYINEELGGVAGHQVEVVWNDNQYDASKSVTIINGLMDAGTLMFATNDSTTMSYSMEIANRASFPGIAVFSAPKLTNPPKHIYATLPDYGDDWSAFTNYYMTNIWKGSGKPKMALLLLNNSTGQGAKDAALAGAAKLGVEIVATEEHTTTTQSEIESLTRVKALKPDVIYISSTPAPTAVIMKNMVQLDMYPKTTVGVCHAAITSALVNAAGADVVEGLYGVYPTVSWGDNVPAMAKMTEYMMKLHPQDKGNMDYITTWAEGLIQAEILRLAIQNAGINNLTPQIIETQGIQKLSNFDPGGLHGVVSYTAGDNRLSKSLRIFKISSGSIAPITGWITAPKIDYNFQ